MWPSFENTPGGEATVHLLSLCRLCILLHSLGCARSKLRNICAPVSCPVSVCFIIIPSVSRKAKGLSGVSLPSIFVSSGYFVCPPQSSPPGRPGVRHMGQVNRVFFFISLALFVFILLPRLTSRSKAAIYAFIQCLLTNCSPNIAKHPATSLMRCVCLSLYVCMSYYIYIIHEWYRRVVARISALNICTKGP